MNRLKRLLIALLLIGIGSTPVLEAKRTTNRIKPLNGSKMRSYVLVMMSYNNADYCEKNLTSAFSQEYPNYRMIYIDDCSKDDTVKKVKAFIKKCSQKRNFQLIPNKKRVGAMANIIKAVNMCEDDEIVVVLDGDDWFPHSKVLNRLNQYYQSDDVWMTYGHYIRSDTYQKGPHSFAYRLRDLREGNMRSLDWRTHHLRTFYAGLFKKVREEDFKWNGKYFDVANDVAIMIPMLEMARERAGFIDEVMYVYNVGNPIRDTVTARDLVVRTVNYIRSLPKYPRLNSLFE